MRYAIFVLMMVMMGVGNVWGETATLSAKSSSVTKNGVTFSLDGSYTINNFMVDYTYTGSGKEATLTWSAPGYTISVSQISINAKNDRSWGTTGKGQYKTSKNSSYTQFCNKNGWDTYTLKSSSYFSLGNDGSITIKAVDKELQYKDIVFTYTQTAKSYTITLDDNKGSGGDATHEVTYNSAIGNLTKTPTKTGYHFMGYYTGEGGTGTKIFNADLTPVKNESGYTSNDNSPKWIKADDVTLYAKWEANTYKVHFDGNHASNGSMSDQDFTYGADAKALTANAFTRSYSITYDANGGSCTTTTANTTATSTFAGWNTKAEGNGTAYTDKQKVSNLTSKHGDVYNLYAQWTGGATLPSATNGKRELVGWYDANDNFVGAAGATYAPTSDVTLTAKWAEKKVPGFIGSGQELQLGGTYSGFQFSNTTTATPSSSTSAKFHYVITEQTVQGNSAGTPNPGKVILFDGTKITAVNKGTAKIKFVQLEDEDNNIEAKESGEFTFTVTKFTPVFTWNAQTYYFNNTYANIFSSTNHDTEITCTSDNEDAAEMFAGSTAYQKTLKTFTDVSATITISQAENFKWEPMAVDNYVVYNNKVSNHVAFDYTQAMYNDNTITTAKVSGQGTAWTDSRVRLGGSNTALVCDESLNFDDKYIDIKFTGYPHKLTFKIAVNEGKATKHYWYVKESSNGTNWSGEIWSSEHNGVDVYSSEEKELNPDTRYIRICYSGNYAGYVKDIHISQLEYFRRQGNNTTLNFATNLKDHVPAVQSFVVEHANAGYQTTVTAPDHYQVSLSENSGYASSVTYSTNATALTGGDKKGTFTVYVKYLADAEGTHSGNVTVSNNLRSSISIPVSGVTQNKYTTTLHFKGTTTKYNVDAANVAATTLFEVRDANNTVVSNPTITLSSSATSVITTASNNTAIDFLCGGKATIYASYAGDDDTYAAASNNGLGQEITVEHNSDNVSWSGLQSDGKLHVWADHDISPLIASAHTRIWYGTGNETNLAVYNDPASINTSTLRTKAYGEVDITAASEGDCRYASTGVSSKKLVVEPCIHEIVWDQKFIGYIADKNGNIHEEVELTAYAVDSLGVRTNVAVSYELGGNKVASVSGNSLTIFGEGVDTIKVRTATSTKYATAEDKRVIRVRRQGSPCGSDVLDVPASKKFSDLKDDTYVLTGPAKQLTCQVKKLTIVTITGKQAYLQGWSASQKKWVNLDTIYEEVDHTDWTNLTYNFKASESRDITKIKFYNATQDGSKNVRNVRVSQLPYITPSSTSVTMSTVKACEEATGEFTVDYSDVAILQLTQTNENFTYEVWKDGVKQDGFENDCENWGTYTLKFKYTPQVKGDYSNTVTISSSGISKTITLSGTANKPDRTITWNVDEINSATATTSVELGATVGTSCQETAGSVTYTITAQSSDGVASLDGNVLSFHKQGSVNVKASAAETDDYLAASEVTKSWNVGKVGVQMRTLPTITSTITYGDTKSVVAYNNDFVAEDVLAYNVVAGSISYVGPDEFTAAGSTNLVFNFTPNNVNTYDVLQFKVPVTVQKANTTLNWTSNPASVVFGNTATYAASSVSDGAITYSITQDGDYASIDANGVLTVLEAGHTITVQASQAEGTNYNAPQAITTTVTLAKANTTLGWTANPTSVTYGNTATYTASSVSDGAITYSITQEGDYASINADGVLTVKEAGHTITVQASQAEGTNYNAPQAITTTVTLAKANTTLNWDANPASVVFGNTATYTASSASNGAITYSITQDGDYASIDANGVLTVKEAGHEVTVQASQAEGTNYNAPQAITTTVTLAKATPNATPSAEAITYGATIGSSELTNSGTTDGAWAWNTGNNDAVLGAGEHTGLAVRFTPKSGNYAVVDAEVTLVVNKANTTLSWTNAPENVSYDATGITYVAESASDGAITYEIIDGVDYASITSEGVLTIEQPGHQITIQASQAEGTNHNAPDAIEVTVTIEAAPVVNYTYNGNGNWTAENWTNKPTTGGEDVIINGNVIISTEVTVNSLTINEGKTVTVTEGGSLTITGTGDTQSGYGDLYVQNGGEVDVEGTLQVGDLTVEASIGTNNGTATSGQVAQAEHITYANAYIEINMDPSGVLNDKKWYGFTVPFEVNARNGISRKVGSTYQNCIYGSDYIIAEFDVTKRLNTGKGWKYLSGNTLNAGQFYYFTADGGYNTYRFKASGNTYSPVVEKSLSMNGEGADANWNAVGNSTLQHATVSFEGSGYVQVYQNGLDAYMTVATNEATFVVGCPFFIQASQTTTLALSVPTSASEKYYAPRRLQEVQTSVSRINLTAEDGGYSDQIYVSGVEKEQDGYVLGHDLSKAGLGTEIPQMWIDAYGQKLSVHEAALYGDNAYCALGLYAPKSGEYLLTATQPTDDTQIFITIDGTPVWNITESDYIVTLNKGTNTSYGLMIVKKTPAIMTGVDNAEADGQKARKVIIDDQMYIITPEGAMYNVTGKIVR